MPNTQLPHTAHTPAQIKYPITLLAHNIESTRNIGSLFRIADALGLEKLYLTGTSPTPPNRKLKKTSRSTEKYVSYQYASDPVKVIEQLKLDGYTIVSLEITSTSTDLRDFKVAQDQPICLILGSENSGVPQALLDGSDISVHIPMLGTNSSMNVANACAIATYEIIGRLSAR